mgnify:FL=1
MKNYILIFICLISSAGFSQEAKCGYYGKKMVAERNKLFPFNIAKRVILVAYKNCEMMSPLADSLSIEEARLIDPKVINKYQFKIKNSLPRTFYFTPATSYFTLQEKELDSAWINELSHILCNYIYLKGLGPILVEEIKCRFTPRNSILFFDENNNLICTYDICFQCGQSAFSPDPDGLNANAEIPECHDRLDEIKYIFRKNGIVYGLDVR